MRRSPCFINVEEGNKATEYIARGIAVVLQADILDDVGFSSFCFSLFPLYVAVVFTCHWLLTRNNADLLLINGVSSRLPLIFFP